METVISPTDQSSEVELIKILQCCREERKEAKSNCSLICRRFQNSLDDLYHNKFQTYNTVELEKIIENVCDLSNKSISCINRIVEKRDSDFKETIRHVYKEGSNDQVDSILRSFCMISKLFSDVIKSQMTQIELKRKIILWTELKSRISTQRSLKEEKIKKRQRG